MRVSSAFSSWRLDALWATMASVCALSAARHASTASPAGATAPGRPLAEALAELQQHGLPLVFSSSVVLPQMVVAQEPAAKNPRQRLDELLAPHGLMAREGPRGRLLVVPAGSTGRPPLGRLSGRVVDDQARGVSAVVSLPQVGATVVTASNGGFELVDIPEGTYRVEVRVEDELVAIEEAIEVRSREAGEAAEVVFRIADLPLSVEEIVVVSKLSLLRDGPIPGVALERDQIQALAPLRRRPLPRLQGAARRRRRRLHRGFFRARRPARRSLGAARRSRALRPLPHQGPKRRIHDHGSAGDRWSRAPARRLPGGVRRSIDRGRRPGHLQPRGPEPPAGRQFLKPLGRRRGRPR